MAKVKPKKKATAKKKEAGKGIHTKAITKANTAVAKLEKEGRVAVKALAIARKKAAAARKNSLITKIPDLLRQSQSEFSKTGGIHASALFNKEGKPLVINGRRLSLSRAIRAGDFVFLTGQIPFKDGKRMIDGTIEDQTHAVLNEINKTLAEANCQFSDVVKTMVWLTDRAAFRVSTLFMPNTFLMTPQPDRRSSMIC